MAASLKIPPAQQAAIAVAIVAAIVPQMLGVEFIDWPLLAIGGSGVGLALALAAMALLRPAIGAILIVLLLIDGAALGWCAAALWNTLADASAGTTINATVIDRNEGRGRRGTRRHSITVEARGLAPIRLSVNERRHDELPPGSGVAVVLHPGALSARWLELAE
jgi:hypothetical protein